MAIREYTDGYKKGFKEGSEITKKIMKRELTLRTLVAPLIFLPILGAVFTVTNNIVASIFLGAGLTCLLWYVIDKTIESTAKWWFDRLDKKLADKNEK
jgi:hypothetical protein